MGDEEGPDKRVEWLKTQLTSAFKNVKLDKLDKALNTGENRNIVTEFLENSDVGVLCFDEALTATAGLPKKVRKGKVFCFVKSNSEAIPTPGEGEGLSAYISATEIAGDSLRHLEQSIHDVYLPLIANPANQEGWGDVVARELVEKLHYFHQQLQIINGQIEGDAVLPLPIMDNNAMGKDRSHLFESAIVQWGKQIRAVLKTDPEGMHKVQGANPTPDVEIEFWRHKAANLNSIHRQLLSKSVNKIIKALDATRSTYVPPFTKTIRDVFVAREEANDNVKYLAALAPWFDKLNAAPSFPTITELFRPILHTVLLIWKNSKHFNVPSRLVVLMREICNAVIIQACKYVSGEQIFTLIENEEAQQAVEQLTTTVRVGGAFKTAYFDYKATASTECPNNPWRLQNNALFVRLDSFLERCHDIIDLTTTIVQFTKLAKIEVGGTKGKTLTTSVQQIYTDFQGAVQSFQNVEYDIMDVSAKQFDDDFYEFRCKIKELERRLGSVITQGFDDCPAIYGRFKLLDSFEGLLERPIIQDELEKKHVALVQSFNLDLMDVQELFLHNKDNPPITWNLPPVAGALGWCRGLVQRIEQPMEKLKELNRAIMEREESKEAFKIYLNIMSSLEAYQYEKIEGWSRDVEQTSQAKLKLPLLVRDPETRLLKVNFDPELVRLLREVKYFLLLDLDVPKSAREIFQRNEQFRQQTGNLDLIVNMYNKMLTTLLPVEAPLVKNHLEKIDKTVRRGIEVMNWRSHGIDMFIRECMDDVKAADHILSTLKNNLHSIENILGAWMDAPLLERKGKPVLPDEFDQMHKALKVQRCASIKEGGKKMQALLKESNKMLKVSNGAPDWRAYVDFVNNIVVEGLCRVVVNSMQFLHDQVDPEQIEKFDKMPMIEISLDLYGNGVMFTPNIGEDNQGKAVRSIINGWVDSFYQIGTIFKRLDTGDGSYVREISSDLGVTSVLSSINDLLSHNEALCVEFREQYEEYKYLWTTDMNTMFARYLEDATRTTEAGLKILDLSRFDEEITKYRGVLQTVSGLKSPTDIGWLRVNSQPIKQALSTWTTKWVYQFTSYLQDHVSQTLQDLADFMRDASAGLKREVKEGDTASLMATMGFIRDVKKRMDEVKDMFSPLREECALLKKHNFGIDGLKVDDDDLLDYLEGAPMKWDTLVNQTFLKKEHIMPLQNAEIEHIRVDLNDFWDEVTAFRHAFKEEAPFGFKGTPHEAYDILDDYLGQLEELREGREQGTDGRVPPSKKDRAKGHEKRQEYRGVKQFNELEELFELPVSKYDQIGMCERECQLLKQVWDFTSLLNATFDSWKEIKWDKIDAEKLEDETKKLQKLLRATGTKHQQIKAWQSYRDRDEQMKNMCVLLPLIDELHSPSMRDRHWKNLSTIFRTRSPINVNNPNFCFQDVLDIGLHTRPDDVSDIVETATKELKIEAKMKMIEEAWTGLSMDFVPHKESEVMIIKPSEVVIESLEQHQLELQTMIGMGKFVDYFRDKVTMWQKALGNVETVLTMWQNATKQWQSLEAIFLASDDIRRQLPDDTKRFEGIDQAFKDLMKEAVEESKVLDSCTKDGRDEVLHEMIKALELCQKSLNEYLDMKKKIFPRFYFVSNVALLDILSNGNNPPRIVHHLGDCYDSICNLTFLEDSINKASAMHAKDGEIVPFNDVFEMEGMVENWLNVLTVVQQDTLRANFEKALDAVVNWEHDLPRHKWLFKYPAQTVLTGTQITWTEECEAALDEYEGGTEDAVKKYLEMCNERLGALINLVLGKLQKSDRSKIIALITMDVHARDVVQKLVKDPANGNKPAEGPGSFLWQQQLRFYWQQETKDTNIRITDYRTKYSYEYVGNTGRLVITPLTDRCYITLTMALRLMLGGAPAGPAGTGKTETTKDLARALALPCYVFNCSDQMNFQTLGDIFKGLSQSGSWGCFDEFNRIPIEVLSVVATQVKTILDAILKFSVPANREPEFQELPAGQPPVKVGMFEFMGDHISIIPTVGFWITMNPGYAGRTELPENLKALFRSCAMIRPDLALICENMLMSEGFQTARPLSIKFVTLYDLSSELLSPQAHYDWGLRAVKSVLRKAGSLKRGNPDLDEEAILMRALRDFNTPKIVTADQPIFLRLISDLFPAWASKVPPTVDMDLKERSKQKANELGLQFDDGFVVKVVQFQELLDVRHSVMLIGSAGAGKTTTWKTLAATHNHEQPKPVCVYETVNPKSVTSDELYGYMTLSKDWKDGVLSIVMRNMAKCWSGYYDYQTMKWVVLDGDIDAVWIESMNTVMDDNKVLTLVSNERIPLSDSMRMIFEINSLANATPATVSRAGILYINDADIGWKPFLESWIHHRESERERATLPQLFDKYIEAVFEGMRKGFKTITPIRPISIIETICHLLAALLPNLDAAKIDEKDMPAAIENYFVFAAIWAFGGPLGADKQADHRKAFNELWRETFSTVKYPKDGLVFDYYFDPERFEMVPWADSVPEYVPVIIGTNAGEQPFSSICCSTMDSVRNTYLLDQLVSQKHAVMFVGGAGTGKTTLVREYLRNLEDDTMSNTIAMNFFTDSKALQAQIESVIDKRSGKIFGPPTGKKMIYFLDDLNMPYVETYGTQNALSLLVQHMCYSTFYDREDLGFKKEVVDTQYVAAMNPTAGSFTICERVQRNFSTFAIQIPDESDLKLIYKSILDGHLQSFTSEVQAMSESIIDASLGLHQQVLQRFLPSAVKFVYNWNMRELSSIVQGLTLAKPDYYPSPQKIVRLWLHECNRVFQDRMINQTEITRFEDMLNEACKKNFADLDQEELNAQPLIFTSFATATTGDPAYLPASDSAHLKSVVEGKLDEYNESNAIMDLVLFEQAIEHVCRITRIIENPAGNAMLVGVGGSGKQSLSKLASFICGYETVQLSMSATFGVADFLEVLAEMLKKAAVKGVPTTFLLTDSQIVDEKFLVSLNNLLASGFVPGLFPKDEMDGIFSGLRNEAKAAGVTDTPETMTEFFISRVRRFLHIVLCFSPVGDTFRVRARKFPALINNTSIDWFHPWPRDALVSVAQRFLEDVELGSDENKENVAHHMAEVHVSVMAASDDFRKKTRRNNYVTPKSYLELIAFYKGLLASKRLSVQQLIDRLDTGLSTLQKTNADVAELQAELKISMVKVEEKKASTDKLLEEMGVQRGEAEQQQEIANVEEAAANEAANEADEIEKSAEKELGEAKPAMDAAAEAVNCLSKAAITELKNFSKPPPAVLLTTSACLMIIEGEFKKKAHTWDRAKKMMNKVDQFLDKLKGYTGEDMSEQLVSEMETLCANPDFAFDEIKSKSVAAANICNWATNIFRYNRIYVKVKPLMDSLNAAKARKAAALEKLAKVQAVVASVEAKMQGLQATFVQATQEKALVEKEANAFLERLGLAERLVTGLSSENKRWGIEIERLRDSETTLVGDALVAGAFVSYIGAFNMQFRRQLWAETWLSDIKDRDIPITEGVDPLYTLVDEGQIAQMQSEGVPADRVSIENGAIVNNCKRWPLVIDPQLQGVKWLRQKEEKNAGEKLLIMQLSQKGWVKSMENALANGFTVIVENVGEDIDATMDPVLGRAIYKKGRSFSIKFAGEECDYDQNFQLYMITKLTNPHYKPEIAAQTTLINFIVTEKGLEDQLLARVVNAEKPELEAKKQELQESFNQYKITLLDLENQLLERLANAPDDILSDVPLIEGLEATKLASAEINEAVEKGKKTEIELNQAREGFRVVATEGAMLYFMLIELCAIKHMYQYSLDSFVTFFYKSIKKAEPAEKEAERVANLRSSLRLTIYTWVSRGLFEDHKLILLAQLTFELMKRGQLSDVEFDPVAFNFLMRGPKKIGDDNPISWLPNSSWLAINALGDLEDFSKMPSDLQEAAPRFQEWYNHSTPENEKLPLDWSSLDKTPFLKLLVVRCLRPDRMTTAIGNFVRHALPNGDAFCDCDGTLNSLSILRESIEDSTTTTPIYFILSPGADVVSDVDKMAIENNYEKNVTYHNVSMGQGQDVIAEEKLEVAHRQGHWVILNNVHLMPRWLYELEKKLDVFAEEGSNERFRLFLSSDPSNGIPIGVLNRSIKLTNEPPAGMKAGLKAAFCSMNKGVFDEFESKTKSITFGLCCFHATLVERKKFGAKGYNMMYPFALGDLRDSAVCLVNYMENAGSKIPWADLKYIFGEIMYGGHIVNDFDRRMALAYLDWYMDDPLLDETELFPFAEDEKGVSFKSPSPTSYDKYVEHIETEFKRDTPIALGLHPNAEIGFRTDQSNELFNILRELQPKTDDGEGSDSQSPQHIAENVLNEILEKYAEVKFDLEDIERSLEEKGPYENVFLQECEQMNTLIVEMVRSLLELNLGFAGELTMTDAMEDLMNSLFMDKVPASWAKRAWPSKRPLASWLFDMGQRVAQLQDCVASNLEVPKCVWISGLVNPQSFLTAIMQMTAQRNNLELDKLTIATDVTKRQVDDLEGPSRDGAYISGLSIQGARWDANAQLVEKSRPKEMSCPIPVINCKAVASEGRDTKGIYMCPTYKTEDRGPTFVFVAQLKTKAKASRWVLAGVAMIMDIVE